LLCSEADASAAADGGTLVEYCYAQKQKLGNYCKDVVLTNVDAALDTTLWKKCKKLLETQVTVDYGTDWSGNEFHDGDKINLLLPPYSGEDVTIALKFNVNLEDRVNLHFKIRSVPLGIGSLECKLDGILLLPQANEPCGSNFNIPASGSEPVSFQLMIDPNQSIGKHSFQVMMNDKQNHQFKSNIFKWETVEAAFL
jgi:hypothetical protein